MKKILFMVILATGITGAAPAFAQLDPNPVFNIPPEVFGRRFTVELDRENSMQVSVTSIRDLAYISNIDSIVKVFTVELALLQDTFASSNYAYRIDYNMDVPAVKKIRLNKTLIDGNYFAIINGAPARLKMLQDTIVISGRIPPDPLRKGRPTRLTHYFELAFYLNEISDLLDYNRLNEMIRIMQQYYKGEWQYRLDDRMQLKKYPEITSATARGYIFRKPSFFFRKAVEIQNYKDHFIPSVSLTPVFVKNEDFKRREISLDIEADFSFEKRVENAIKTCINVFAGIGYSVIPDEPGRKWAKIYPRVQLAYLLHRSGSVFDKGCFRFGPGSFRLNNFSTMIEPAFYFNHFLKNVSPSLRIIQRF